MTIDALKHASAGRVIDISAFSVGSHGGCDELPDSHTHVVQDGCPPIEPRLVIAHADADRLWLAGARPD
jgi:hypothetical protein